MHMRMVSLQNMKYLILLGNILTASYGCITSVYVNCLFVIHKQYTNSIHISISPNHILPVSSDCSVHFQLTFVINFVMVTLIIWFTLVLLVLIISLL